MLFLIIISYNKVFAQEVFAESIKVVDEFVNYINSYNSYDEVVSDFDTMSIERLKHYTKLLYNSMDLYGFYFKESLGKVQDIQGKPQNFDVVYYLINQTTKRISPLVGALSSFNFLVELEVTNVKSIPYQVDNMTFDKRIISGRVKGVIKGSTLFHENDSVDIYFFPVWEIPSNEFKKDESYLIPITFGGEGEFAVSLNWRHYTQTKNIETSSIPIKGGHLIDRANLFGFGDSIQLEEFRNNIKSEINKINSW